jgi:hypothetical protein
VSGPAIDAVATQRADARAPRPGLRVLVREWGRIECIGFGGPPAHIALLRKLCVTRRGWLSDHEFEDAIAAANLLPGPASTPAGDLLRVAPTRHRGGTRRRGELHPARADPRPRSTGFPG